LSEYLHVERPFLDQLATLGWEVIDQECGMIPSASAGSQPSRFRRLIPLEVFGEALPVL